MINTLRTALAVVCILVITACAVLILRKTVARTRADLTQHKLYTLSQGTRNILAKLNQPVKLKFYYSRIAALKGPEQIRPFIDYALYVQDLLQEYVSLAHGELTLEIIDPRRFSDEEEDAIARGVEAVPLSKDENFFFGLVAQTELGKQNTIPFFDRARQEFLEYDLSKLIAGVTRRDKKKIGLLSSLEVMGSDMSPYMMQMMRMQGREPKKPWSLVQALREEFEVEALKPDADSIPGDIDFLMIVHPKNLPQAILFAIDQFVMGGGKLIVFVDPHCLSDEPPRDPRNPYAAMGQKKSSDLNVLLKTWGVEMDPDLIAADRALAVTTAFRRGQRPAPVLIFLELAEQSVNADEVITAKLHNLKMLFAGVLKPVPDSGASITLPQPRHVVAIAPSKTAPNPSCSPAASAANSKPTSPTAPPPTTPTTPTTPTRKNRKTTTPPPNRKKNPNPKSSKSPPPTPPSSSLPT